MGDLLLESGVLLQQLEQHARSGGSRSEMGVLVGVNRLINGSGVETWRNGSVRKEGGAVDRHQKLLVHRGQHGVRLAVGLPLLENVGGLVVSQHELLEFDGLGHAGRRGDDQGRAADA